MPECIEVFTRSRRGILTGEEAWRLENANDWHFQENDYERECESGARTLSRSRSLSSLEAWKSLPLALNRVGKVIAESREMLNLSNDWNEEGAKKIDENTWRRSVTFLARYALRVLEQSGRVLDAPDITPSVDGSVDIHWDNPAYEMLIVIPPDINALASFYGKNRGRSFIKGEFDLNELNKGLIEWLTKT